MSYKRSSLRNQKAKLAADYNELLKELSSREMTSVGCYTIGESIGEGTFGKVKLGTHKLTGHQVAVKKISKQHASMIAREIHHHRQLEHPNIVRIYEIIVTESAIHIFSEYCPNGELFDLLASTGRFSESRAQRWFQQLTNALQLCHRQGIVHRDLKLENILLDSNDNCKICDFGFARFTDNKQLLETFCGSLAYSAPEVIMRQKYTGPETDIWSLGVILYTLLAGELPFDDDSEITTQRKIVNVDYEMPCYFSPYAQDLIANLLKREPTYRLTMDQIINHPWMQSTLMADNHENGDTLASHVMELDCNLPSNRDDIDDDDDDDDSSSSTRYSSRSDLDSIFSNPRFKNDLMEEDEDDLVTEASFVSNSELPGKPGDGMQQHNFRKSGFNNYSDGSKFSPQVRSSLGMIRPEDKAKYTSRPPRFSAPTVSNRTSTPSNSPFRSSLPLSLPSNRESILPSSISPVSSLDSPMNYTEQRLATALVTAGFDEYIVQSMRSNTNGTSNTLWNMLMEKQQQRQRQPQRDLDFSSSTLNNHYQKSIDTSDRWSASTFSAPKQHFSRGIAPTPLPVDSACQTNPPTPPPPAVRIDCMTQTIPLDILPPLTDSNKLIGMDTKRRETPPPQVPLAPPKPPSSTINNNQSYSSFGNTSQISSAPRSIPSVASSSSMSLASSEKSGWFTSVKSWFGGNTGKPESGFYETPMRSSSVRQHNQHHGQPVSYRDFDFCQSGGAQQQDELTPGIYRSGPAPKYRRQTLRSVEWNQQTNDYNTRKDSHRTHHLNMDHLSTAMGGMLSPPPPTAAMTTTKSLSIVTTPKYVSSTVAAPSVLSPPAPPAAIYTNNSKNSNNRQCYQNQCLPRQVQQQQPSPPPTPPDAEPTSTIPNFPAFSNNGRTPSTTSSSKSTQPPKPSAPSPLSASSSELTPIQPLPSTPSSNMGMKKSAAPSIPLSPPPPPPPPSSSSPLPTPFSSPTKDSLSFPPTPPTTTDEEEKKEWRKINNKADNSIPSLVGMPLPTFTDSSLSHLKPYSSKSSPALLSSSPKNGAIGPASRRFEFTPCSRLSVYGMNERASSMASKAIIEEEEEEEE